LEEAIRDRISFQWFLGSSFTDKVPDETTICRFGGLLAERGLEKRLFDLINEQLDSMGLILHRGSLIDATLVEAQRRPGGDPDADWTVRGKKAHHGYKVHMTVDHGSEMIRNVDLTPASPPQADGDHLWG
jgi:IS5 family transposase